jgi:hypothetical protein
MAGAARDRTVTGLPDGGADRGDDRSYRAGNPGRRATSPMSPSFDGFLN